EFRILDPNVIPEVRDHRDSQQRAEIEPDSHVQSPGTDLKDAKEEEEQAETKDRDSDPGSSLNSSKQEFLIFETPRRIVIEEKRYRQPGHKHDQNGDREWSPDGGLFDWRSQVVPAKRIAH